MRNFSRERAELVLHNIQSNLAVEEAVDVAHINCLINSYCHGSVFILAMSVQLQPTNLMSTWCAVCYVCFIIQQRQILLDNAHNTAALWGEIEGRHTVHNVLLRTWCAYVSIIQWSQMWTCDRVLQDPTQHKSTITLHPLPSNTIILIRIMPCGCTTYVGACKCTDSVSMRVWNWDVNNIHYLTSHVAALSTASPDGSAHSYPNLVSRSRLAFGCLQCAELCSKNVDCSPLSSTPHVAALALKAMQLCN